MDIAPYRSGARTWDRMTISNVACDVFPDATAVVVVAAMAIGRDEFVPRPLQPTASADTATPSASVNQSRRNTKRNPVRERSLIAQFLTEGGFGKRTREIYVLGKSVSVLRLFMRQKRILSLPPFAQFGL